MPPSRRLARVLSDQALYAALFAFLAVQTAAASAQHAHDALIQGGQGTPAWLPWTLAGTPELLAVLATLEYRHRQKRYGDAADVAVPRAIIVGSALVLMGAQLVTAQRTPLGYFTAAWPALAFLVAVALVETRPRPATATARRARSSSPAPAPAPGPAPEVLAVDDVELPVGVGARLDTLDDNARNVYGVLTGPGVDVLTAAQIREATGLDKDRALRATRKLVAAELVTSPAVGTYAARKIGAVA